MGTHGYHIKHPERIQNLGKASQQSLREAMQELLGNITETRVRINIIAADIANAKEREERYRNSQNEARDSRLNANQAAADMQAANNIKA